MNLNAYKIAKNYLNTYKEEYATSRMDPMMVPFKELLTENGYITLHSCSAHVKVKSFNTGIFGEKLQRSIIRKKNRWYIMFVAVNDIGRIENVVNNVFEKYGYDMQLSKRDHPFAIEAWVVDYDIEENFNYERLYEINKNIYMEFKKEFEK